MYTLDNLRTTIECKEQILRSKIELSEILLKGNKLESEKDLEKDKSITGIKLKVSYWETKVEIARLTDEIEVNKQTLSDKENAENAQKAIESQYAPIVNEKASWDNIFEAVNKVLAKKNIDKSLSKQLIDARKAAAIAATKGTLQEKIGHYRVLQQAIASIMPEIIL